MAKPKEPVLRDEKNLVVYYYEEDINTDEKIQELDNYWAKEGEGYIVIQAKPVGDELEEAQKLRIAKNNKDKQDKLDMEEKVKKFDALEARLLKLEK